MTITATATATATLTDATMFIRDTATESDLEQILDAVKHRRALLRAVVAAAVSDGADGTLGGLSPKYLNGLRGTVQGIRGQRADVLLTADSTRDLRYRGARKFYIPRDTERYVLTGVPLSCIAVD